MHIQCQPNRTRPGGTVSVDSAPDAGSTFTIWLPRASAAGRAAETDSEWLAFLPESTRDLLVIFDQAGALPGDCRLLEPRGVP
jgi:hypothetical protein